MIRKADIILAVILIISGLYLSYTLTSGSGSGSTVNISINGNPYASYSLEENRTITVESGNYINKITINNQEVSMTFSNCTGQDCVKHRPISETSETLVCLPHKLIIEIDSTEDSSFDAISR